MEIKNDLVRIKIGDKKYDFSNLILDEYLKRFAKSQIDGKRFNIKELKCCLLKFDTPFNNLTSDSELHNQDFDICFDLNAKYNQTINENQITIQYNYKADEFILCYKDSTVENVQIQDYYGRKITAIGFNNIWINDKNWENKCPVCAVLDTSNYNIYLQQNQDLVVTRRDIIITDTLFYSNNTNFVPGPAHLAPSGLPQIIEQEKIYNKDKTAWLSFYDNAYGILYSVGLGKKYNEIEDEKIIGQDINIELNGNELTIKGIKNYKEYSKSNLLNMLLNSVFNDKKLQRKKYIILKYKVFQEVHTGTYENTISTITDTGYYYYQSVLVDKYGKTNLKIKYERSR